MAWQNTGHLRSAKKEFSDLPSLSDIKDTSLGLFLHAIMKRLPVELVGIITQCVGDGLFSSLTMTSETLAWIKTIGFTRIMESENHLSKKQVFSVNNDIQHLGLNSIQVMGENCLVGLQYDPKVCRSQIPVAKKQIKGLQFGLGFHGVIGLRIVYVDGSSSPWLGHKSPQWIKSIRGSDLTQLRMVFDVSQETQKHNGIVHFTPYSLFSRASRYCLLLLSQKMKCRPPTRPASFGTMIWALWSEIEAPSLTHLLFGSFTSEGIRRHATDCFCPSSSMTENRTA
jgi:hypothetical protein